MNQEQIRGPLCQAQCDVEALIGEIERLSQCPQGYLTQSFAMTRAQIESRAKMLLEGVELGHEDRARVAVYRLSMLSTLDRHEKKCLDALPSHQPGDASSKYSEAWQEIKIKYGDDKQSAALEAYADLKELIEDEILAISQELFLNKRFVFIGAESEASKLGILLSIDDISMTSAEVEWLQQAYLQAKFHWQIWEIIEAVNEIEFKRSGNLFRSRLPRSLFALSQIPPTTRLQNQAMATLSKPKMTYRTSFCLRGIVLQHVPNDVFVPCSALKSIVLSYNNTYRLSPFAFRGLSNLCDLDLSYNDIEFIGPGLFSCLVNLRELRLQNNLIEKIDPWAFGSLTQLKVLNLEQNRLTEIHRELLSKSVNLTNLYLSSNEIAFIDMDAFRNTSSLTIIHLTNNKLAEVNLSLFSHLASLQILDLRHNAISQVNRLACSMVNAEETDRLMDQSDRKSGLKKLRLQFNKIKSLDKNTFKGLSSLEFLGLSNNQIEVVSENAFEELTTLETLDLGSNLLIHLERRTFAHLTNLTVLYLQDNLLTSLHEEAFLTNKKLARLNLRGNRMNELRSKEKLQLVQLDLEPEVEVSGNIKLRRARRPMTFKDCNSFMLFLFSAVLFISVIILIILTIRKMFQYFIDLF